MRAADGRHGLDILAVELARGDQGPVRLLLLFGMGDMRIAGEEAGSLRVGFGAQVERVERGSNRRLDDRLQGAEPRALLSVKAEKMQTIGELGGGGLSIRHCYNL